MKHTLLLLAFSCFLLVSSFSLQAQPLRSQGPIPADLKMSVRQLYDSDMQRAEKYAGGRVRDKQQILEASYRINKMLAGGHIIYGDPLTAFINRIADTLLADYPTLRSELRFYTVTSPDVNAFTTPQGMIFINVGLVAQAEDESQLAFIIAHEIIHYYRAHGMETLLTKKEKKRKRETDLDDEAEREGDFMSKHNRSHEMENEADSLGIVLFYRNSPYWKEVTEGVFDVLQYSELPFDELPFDTTFFNTPYYRLTGCWLDTVADITSRDDYDDSRSSHPNILKRRQRTAQLLAKSSGGQKYLMVTQQEFERLRHIARIECIRQDLLHGHFPRAFYNSWVLINENQNENSSTLNSYLAQALYGVAVFKCNDKASSIQGDYTRMEGESQQVYYAFNQMSAEQSALIALHKVWELHQRYPNDKSYTDMADHLMELLRTTVHKAPGDYLATPPSPTDIADTPESTDNASDKPLTKYERIKQKRQSQNRQNPTTYALTDLLLTDTTLHNTLNAHLTDPPKLSTQNSKLLTNEDAMLVFNPSYWVFNRNDELRTAESDACEENLINRIAGTANGLGIRTADFSDQGMHSMTSAAQYNDFITVCEWMNEFWLTKGLFEYHRICQTDMDRLLSRYDARTLNMTAVLNMEGKNMGPSLSSAFLLPLAPIALASAFTGMEHTFMVSLVVDAHEGKMLARQVYGYNVADHSALVDAMLHDTFVRTVSTQNTKTASGKEKEPVGFLGHRFALAAGFNLGMAGKQHFKAGQILALTPWVSAEFAINRNTTIAFSTRYQKGNPDIYQYTYQDFPPYRDSVQSSRNMLTLGLELRRYRSSDFAPYGHYVDFGAHLVRCTTLDKFTSDNTFGLHVGLGRNYIFRHRFLLNYQIDYGYTYGVHQAFFGFEEDTAPYGYYGDAILSNLITIKLGIGLLP